MTYHNADEIIPRLWLGAIDPTYDLEFFRRNGITHVVTALESRIHGASQIVTPSEHIDRFRTTAMINAAVEQFYAPVWDHPNAPLGYYFSDVCRFIDDALSRHPTNTVYVHCFAGISRSSTLVAAYLILRDRLTPNAAIELIRAKRPRVDPNPGFRQQLVWWNDYVRAQLKETAPIE